MDPQEYCCGVTETEIVLVQCSNYEIPLQKVMKCGCHRCTVLPVTISGQIVSALDNSPLIFGGVFMDDEMVSFTDFNGKFMIVITEQISRVVLTFKDTYVKNLVETTKVVNVQSGSNVYLNVKMKQRPIPVTVPSDVDNNIVVGGDQFEPLGEIVIPAHSAVDMKGELYTGDVDVHLTNIDARSEEDLESAPGDFSAVDDNGNIVQLETFGMFRLGLTGSGGQRLSVGGVVRMNIDPSVVPLERDVGEDGVSGVRLWTFDTKNGVWVEASQLVRTPERRGRRQVQYFAGLLELSSSDVFNLDVKAEDTCWAKVLSYGSNSFSSSDILSDVAIRVIAQDNAVANNGDASFRRYFRGYAAPGEIGACLQIACDSTNMGRYTNHISAEIRDTHLIPDEGITVQNEIINESSQSITTSAIGQSSAQIMSDIGFEITSGSVNDAIKVTVDKDAIERMGSSGPLYTGNRECMSAGPMSNAFRFYLEINFTTDFSNTQTMLSPPLGQALFTRYAFYPLKLQPNYGRPASFQCCMRIRVYSPRDMVRVKVTSSPSDASLFEDNQPFQYGFREVKVRKDSDEDDFIDACLEYKCPGLVSDGSDGFSVIGADITTTLKVEVKDINGEAVSCRACTNLTLVYNAILPHNPDNPIPRCPGSVGHFRNSFDFKMPSLTGLNTGVHEPNLDNPIRMQHDIEKCASVNGANALSLYDTQ